jgi:glycosyltransferase involved in cell wall biosynthesis
MRVLACNSPYGQGGIGQHFAQLVEETRRHGLLKRYYADAVKAGDEMGTEVRAHSWLRRLVTYSPLRWSPSWKQHVLNEGYDRRIARALEGDFTRFMGFAGKSLHCFRRAEALGATRLELVAPNSHVENVRRLHTRAAEETGVADSWLNDAQIRKTVAEYETADTIYVHSDYVRSSFLAAGIPASKLVRTHLEVAPRFQPPASRPDGGPFRVVYVGRLDATKGIPLLLDAFDRLDVPEKELVLVGGWATRTMRRFLAPWLRRPDLRHAPGDPLPILRTADVFVHPSYEDGFGYAPAEALACGLPVVVTEDTGMKEHVRDGTNGYVVPTGRVDALVDRLQALFAHPLSRPYSLLDSPPSAASTPPPSLLS